MISKPKLFDNLYKIFFVALSVIFFWIITLNVFNNSYFETPVFVLYLFLMILLVPVLIRFWDKFKDTPVNFKWFLIVFSIVVFALLLFLGKGLAVGFTWDYGEVHRNAYKLATTGEFNKRYYALRYPGNNFVLILLTCVYKVVLALFGNIGEYWFAASAIFANCFIVLAAILFTILAIKNIWNKNVAVLAGIGLVFCTPILFYVSIFYTDTIGLFFVALLLYILTLKPTVLKFLLAGVVSAIGYRIKAFVVIIIIAFIIDYFLKSKDKSLEKVKKIATSMVAFLLVLVISGAVFDGVLGFTADDYKDEQFPLMHWVMMGSNDLHSSGGYHEEDVTLTKNAGTYDEKQQVNIDTLKQRLDDFGVAGIGKHYLINKVVRAWTNGTYATDDYVGRKPINDTVANSFVIRDGTNHLPLRFGLEFTHLFLLISIFLYAILVWTKKIQNGKVNYLFIAILGLFILLVVWECNSRYLYTFLPILFIAGISGLQSFTRLIRSRKAVDLEKEAIES